MLENCGRLVGSLRTSAFAVVAVICIIGNASSLSTTEPVVDRAVRVLADPPQTFGGYTIQKGPEIDKNCVQKGINPDEFSMASDQLKSEMESITAQFQGPRELIIKLMETMDYSKLASDPGNAAGPLIVPVGYPLTLAIVSFLSLLFMIFYKMVTACCCKKKTCCMKQKREGDPMSFGQKFVLVSSVLAGLALIIVTIIWAAQMGSTVKSVKYFPCAIASMYNDMVNGYSNGQYTFVGVNGIIFTIDKIQTAINKFGNPTNNPKMQDVLNLNLVTKGTTLAGKVDTLLNAHSPTKSTYTGYRVVSSDILTNPDSIKAMDEAIGNGLRTEISKTVEAGKLFDSAAKTIIDLTGTGLAPMSDTFKQLNDQITQVKTQLSSFQAKASDALPTDTLENVMKLAMAVAIIFFIVTTVVYFVILYFNMFRNKCHCMKCLSKLIMVLKMFLSILFNFLVVLFALLCVVFSNFCYIVYTASTDEMFLKSKIQQQQLQQVFSICVMPSGSGNLSALLPTGDAQSKIADFNTALMSLNKLDELSAVFEQATPQPPVGSALDQLYIDSKEMKRDDFSSNPDYSFSTLMTDLNTRLAGGNVFRFNGGCSAADPTPYLVAGNTGPYNDQASSNLCFQLNLLPAGTTIRPRYSTDSTADDKYARLFASFKKMRQEYGGVESAFSTNNWYIAWKGLYDDEKQYYQDMKTAYTNIKDIKNQAVDLVQFLSTFAGDLFKVLNCKVVNKEILTIQVAVCTKFTKSLMQSTSSMTALGLIIFIFSWCICCGVRCAPQRDPAIPKLNQVEHLKNPEAYNYPAMESKMNKDPAVKSLFMKPVAVSPSPVNIPETPIGQVAGDNL